MIVNNHRKHSSFALRHFIAGSCYTPDAAYCLLYAQMEQIEMDIASGEAQLLEREADILEFSREDSDPAINLRNRAKLIKLQGSLANFEKNFEGAKRELTELRELLEQLKPQCKYWNEDVLQMEQDMQRDEWAAELKGRAENMILGNMLGSGFDHIATMRQHPDFEEKILPHIKTIVQQAQQTRSDMSKFQLTKPVFQLEDLS